MPIDYPAILGLKDTDKPITYTQKDTILYAIAVGLGDDPMNLQNLDFIYEKNLKALPTLATVVAWQAGIPTDQLGVNYNMVLHAEEETILHQPMPTAAEMFADSGVSQVYDKGEAKGALIVRETVLRHQSDGAPIATIRRTILARSDGGSGGSKDSPAPPSPLPDREPDQVIDYPTALNQAAIYRLCGDRNPLHIDPESARAAGFERPILHGLCTYGFTCRAVVEAFCNFDPDRVASHRARFSAPVYPGETLRIRLWRDGNIISHEAETLERGVKVSKFGRTELR